MNSSNSKKDPKRLMQEAKNGDADAFGCLYEIYFKPVFRYIYFRVKDRETANDLTQTVFLKVFKTIEAYQNKNKSPLAYFFTVARNTIIDYWKKKKEVSPAEPEKFFTEIPDTADSPQTLAEKADTIEMVQQAIRSLTSDQQEVIVLKFINDLPNEEIAKILGKNEEAIRQLQCRALKALRAYLKESKYYERQQ